MRYLRSALWFVLVALMVPVTLAAAQSGPGSGPVSAEVAALIGAGASVLTAAVAGVAGKLDTTLGNADGRIRNAIGPALPLVTTVLAGVLPMASNIIGLSEVPDAAIIANAPVSAVFGVFLREATRKWLWPRLTQRQSFAG